MASTIIFVKQCSKQLNLSFPHAPSSFLSNGYNLLFRAYCFSHFYSLILPPLNTILHDTKFSFAREKIFCSNKNNNNCNFRKKNKKQKQPTTLKWFGLLWYHKTHLWIFHHDMSGVHINIIDDNFDLYFWTHFKNKY